MKSQTNKWGIYFSPQLSAPRDNTFYNNNFEDNSFNVYVNESAPIEFWDNGPQVGGNYWSNYQTFYSNASEIGTSGIEDTPYLVYESTYDKYPLASKVDTSSLGPAPSSAPTPPVPSNGLVASWSFDSIDSNGVSTDSTGKNPAVLGSTNGNKSYIPQSVDGKYGKALSFDGQTYITVPAAPSLEPKDEVSIDVWVNVQSYKEIPYNNIFVQCVRTTDPLPQRTFGLAINGELPQNSSSPALGALRGYVLTADGLNEIITTNSVAPLNQWIHVVFTRSLATGMHIYVDGKEQETTVTSGTANPSGEIVRPTETYIGHDAVCTIDELNISNDAISITQSIPIQWLVLAILVALATSVFLIYRFRRH